MEQSKCRICKSHLVHEFFYELIKCDKCGMEQCKKCTIKGNEIQICKFCVLVGNF